MFNTESVTEITLHVWRTGKSDTWVNLTALYKQLDQNHSYIDFNEQNPKYSILPQT